MESLSQRTMRALVQKSYDGPRDLTLVHDHPRPKPGPGDYLVRVGVAGVNYSDVMQTRGTYGGGPQPPYVAGFEAAGEIVAVGAAVEAPLALGTHVIGAGPGAYAEYMIMPAAEALPVPPGWSDAESLGLVLNWVTAVAALRPLGHVGRGDVVLVHAAAGGVGQAAVRAALHYGARVVATTSPHKQGVVRELGVDVVLDPSSSTLTQQVLDAVGQVDVVLDGVGRTTFETSLTVAKPYVGRVVVYGAASGDAGLTTKDLVFTHRVQIKGLHIGALAASRPDVYRSVLDEIGRLIENGVYPPGAPRVHQLTQGSKVLEDLESGRTAGKHAIDPWK